MEILHLYLLSLFPSTPTKHRIIVQESNISNFIHCLVACIYIDRKRASRKFRWFELEGYTVDTMAFICWGTKPVTFKNMTKVASASSTSYLHPYSIWVWTAIYGPRETFIERRPATGWVEFGCGSVEGSATTSAEVGAYTEKLVILPTPWIPVKWKINWYGLYR